MFVIPSPEEVVVCTELTNGLGRRLPSFFTVENVVIVKDESTVHLADNYDSEKKTNGKHPSVKPMCKDQAKKKLTLEELKKKSLHPDTQSSRPLLDRKDLTRKPP